MPEISADLLGTYAAMTALRGPDSYSQDAVVPAAGGSTLKSTVQPLAETRTSDAGWRSAE